MSEEKSNLRAIAGLAALTALSVAGHLMSDSKDSSSNTNSSTTKDSKSSNVIHELRGS
jgi:hypothetical protein